MTRTLTLLALAAFLAAPVAEARPARIPTTPGLGAALKARQVAMNDFSARMSRLDALTGARPATPVRTRSAEAGR